MSLVLSEKVREDLDSLITISENVDAKGVSENAVHGNLLKIIGRLFPALAIVRGVTRPSVPGLKVMVPGRTAHVGEEQNTTASTSTGVGYTTPISSVIVGGS